jgi:hypothetical protein
MHESRIWRVSEISCAVASSIFLIVASLTEASKTTFLLKGLVAERTNTTGQRSLLQQYWFLPLSLVRGFPHCGQFAISITQTHRAII